MPPPDFADIHARAFDAGVKQARLDLSRYRHPAAKPLMASAKVIDLGSQKAQNAAKRRRLAWSAEAWGYFDTLGEAKYGARFKGRAMAKLRWYAGWLGPDSDRPIPIEEAAKDPQNGITAEEVAIAQQSVDRLKGGDGSHYQMLYGYGVCQFIAGDGYLIGYADPEAATGETWAFVSTDELVPGASGTEWKLVPDLEAPADDRIPLPPEAFVMRMWTRHPRFSSWADSPVRGVLDVCEDLYFLQRLSIGTSQQRLNNGVWLVPETAFGQTEREVDGTEEGESRNNPVLDNLIQYMADGIQNPHAPSGGVPYVLSMNVEDIAAQKYVTFGREFDKTSIERMKLARERFAAGVDLPGEIILGLGDTTHWNAWQIKEDTFQMHIEPDAIEFASSVTSGYQRPYLAAANMRPEIAHRIVMWYDETDLVTKPDEGDDADDAWDRLTISDTAYRRMKGISENDAPTQEEWDRRAALKTNKDITETKAVGIVEGPPSTPIEPVEVPQAGAPVMAAAPKVPTVEKLNGMARRWVEADRILQAKLLAIADAAMRRALEKAGARLRSRVLRAGGAPKEVANRVTQDQLAATLGRAVVASLATPEELLNEAFADAQVQFDRAVARSQAAVRADLGRLPDFDDDDMAALSERQDNDRRLGAALFAGTLATLAGERLFNPSPNAPLLGEHDPDLSVPVGLVRGSMARAGGADVTLTPGYSVLVPPGSLPSGSLPSARGPEPIPQTAQATERVVTPLPTADPATGVSVGISTLDMISVRLPVMTTTYTWEHDNPLTDFEPHVRLNGEEFSSWDDPKLLNEESFPDNEFYFPGDHDGCCCDFSVSFTDSSNSDESTDGEG